MKNILIISIAILLFTSCSKKITVKYQASKENTGTVKVIPAKPTASTMVLMNDSLIVNKKKVKSITIENVPIGTHKIEYSADNSNYQYPIDTVMTIEMQAPNKEIIKRVKIPPYSTGYYIYSGLGLVGALLVVIFLL